MLETTGTKSLWGSRAIATLQFLGRALLGPTAEPDPILAALARHRLPVRVCLVA